MNVKSGGMSVLKFQGPALKGPESANRSHIAKNPKSPWKCPENATVFVNNPLQAKFEDLAMSKKHCLTSKGQTEFACSLLE